mgnify:CR=1 FL=1
MIKFMFSKKATKKSQNLHRRFDIYLLSECQIDVGDFVIFLWPLRTLKKNKLLFGPREYSSRSYIIVCTYI